MNENTTIPPVEGVGFLIVQVATANGSIPLENASVRVSRVESDGRTVLYELKTGADGRTRYLPLPTPPRAQSLSYTAGARPYAIYTIEVSHPEYSPINFESVPIFDGIISIQQANLSPVPENGMSGAATYRTPNVFESPQNDL